MVMSRYIPVPPKNVAITELGPVVADEEVYAMCIIEEVYPAAGTSAIWIYPSGAIENAGEPVVEEREDGKHKVTYTSDMTFTRDDHGDDLTCCAEWDGILTSSCASRSILVYCEYNTYIMCLSLPCLAALIVVFRSYVACLSYAHEHY